MTAVKAGDVDRAVRGRSPDILVLLFYGPDGGRVAERARAAAEAAVSDPSDPFQFVRLGGDDVADQPGKLVEEAATYGLFGERRAIWVRPTARAIAPSVAACLDGTPAGTLIVIEAGDLSKSAPLRTLCEGSKRALALPCYADEDRDTGALLAEAASRDGLAVDPDARDLLLQHLGGDRLASRGEIDKLLLYVRGRTRITAEDVAAVVSDVSGLSIDAALDAAFLGHPVELEAELRQLCHHGTAPAAILSMSLRHALSLAAGRASLDGGSEMDGALRSWRGLPFRRRETIQKQLGRWPSAALSRVITALQQTTLESRRTPGLAETLAGVTLFRIAAAASARRGG